MVALPSPRLLLLQQSSHLAQRQSTNQYFNRNKSRKTQSDPSHAFIPTLSINYYRSSNIATVSTNWQKCFLNSNHRSSNRQPHFPHFGIIAQNSHNQFQSRCKMFEHSSKRISSLSSVFINFIFFLFRFYDLQRSECKHFASLSMFVSSLTLLIATVALHLMILLRFI